MIKCKLGKKVGHLCYRDDSVIFAENGDTRGHLYELSIAYKVFSMKISKKKTKTMTTAAEPVQCKIVADNELIE